MAAERPLAGGRRAGDPRVFYRSIFDFLRDLPGTQQRFWALVVVTGAAAGFGAVLLNLLLRAVIGLSWPTADTFLDSVVAATPGHRALILVLAGALVSAVAILLRRPLGGHGTSGIIQAIWVGEGAFSLRRALARGVLAITVVGMGAPLGREGALISSGAGAGSWLGRRFGLSAYQTRILVGCGAASGIAAAYNVPIGGALFGLEVLLGSFALELFGPIVVSTVTATVLSRVLLESHPAYVIPYYRLLGSWELLTFALLAPIFGLASALYVKGVESFAALPERSPRWLRPLLPLVAMGVVAILALRFPELLGNGYDVVDLALLGELPLLLLIVLPALKLFSSSICAGAGIPGGLFTPSLFFGALLGGACGEVIHLISPNAGPVGAYALVGMAAVLAGTTHAAISSVLIIFEMTRDYGVILPLMVACVISTAVSRMIEGDSLYTGVLRRRGVPLPEVPQPRWRREELRIKELVEPEVETVDPSLPFDQVVRKLLTVPAGSDLYVTHPDGSLLGAIILDQLKGHLSDYADLEMVVAADLADRSTPRIPVDGTLADAAKAFGRTHLYRLPVVDEATGAVVGTLPRSHLARRGRF